MILTKEFLDRVLEREGGFSDHPDDRGGPTNYGITQETLSTWLGRQATVQDVRDLQPATAREIYRRFYWSDPGFNKLHTTQIVAELLFDAGVNHGVFKATQLLQRAVGVTEDGLMGPETRTAVTCFDQPKLFIRLLEARYEFYAKIVRSDPTQSKFIVGWVRRLNEFLNRFV